MVREDAPVPPLSPALVAPVAEPPLPVPPPPLEPIEFEEIELEPVAIELLAPDEEPVPIELLAPEPEPVPIELLAPEESPTGVVPIESLLYSGRAALERADQVRQLLEGSLRTASDELDRVEPLVRELLDLVPLALADGD
jgi:hypothetical protein